MNLVCILGRIVAEPEVRYAQTNNGTLAYGSYTIAVDRSSKKEEKETDFIRCKVVGKTAEFVEKYLHKGMKVAIEGSIRVDNYTDQSGNKKSTTYVQVTQHEFCESKGSANTGAAQSNKGYVGPNSTFPAMGGDFVSIPDSLDSDFLPFN
jgi:single-strand DNA-binding protein